MIYDRNKKPFEEGLYKDATIPDNTPSVYLLSSKEGMWIARSSSGSVYELGLPQGLPDSSIMPEGMVDASSLEKMTQPEIFRVIRVVSERIKEDSSLLALLAGVNNIS